MRQVVLSIFERTRRIFPLLVMVSLTACGFGGKATPTPEPVTLRYVTFAGLAAAEDALIQKFQADNPYVTITSEPYIQAPDQYFASTPPDLMLITPGQFLDSAIAQGGLTDISDLWQQAGVDQEFLPSLRALSEHEGKQYYLPVGYNWSGIYYNQQIFAQYGLQPPRTWDEFTQICETLVINGVIPLSASGDDPFMGTLWLDYLDLRLNGPTFHQQFTNGEIAYDDSQVRSVFEQWAALVEKGYFADTASRMGTLEALTAVTQQGNARGATAAMVLSGPAFMGEMDPKLRSELGFFPFPVMDPSQPNSEVVMALGYMTPAQAPHRDEALRFLSLLASAPGRDMLTKDVVASGLYAPAFTTEATANLPATVAQGMAMVQQADAVTPPYFMRIKPSMWPAVDAMLRRVLSEPGSAKGFDLDDLLRKLEAVRR